MDAVRGTAYRGQTRAGVIALFAVLAAINGAAWVALFAAAHKFALLLPLGITAYVLGLRHAVDPDHIAAIDGTTRKLLHEGKPAQTVGFFFSLGHSTIVFVLSLLLAAFGSALKTHFPSLQTAGALFGTGVSALFLIAIAAANCVVLFEILRGKQPVDAGFPGGGFLVRLLRPALRTVKSAPQMYPVGVLFGLGFDTATEVALLGISAASAAGGMPMAYILILPWLFTAGMSLVDSLEGVAMLGAYGWADVQPARKLVYNLNMTVLTIAIALFVAVAESADAMGAHLAFSMTSMGYGIMAIFGANVATTAVYFRLRRRG
ncbi:MAG TPA: hypothetical protein VMF61_16040 [Candidatus Acidoferrales bacterium]|nr:hypothetical protein [Candidatus Acidoferrales bacterium]